MGETTTTTTTTTDPEPTSDSRARLVDLIINQDHIAQGWIKHLVSIQAALAVGLGFVLKIGGEHPGILEPKFLPWAILMIPLFGIASAAILCVIIVRERKCQAAYVEKFNYRQPQNPKPEDLPYSIFPTHEEIEGRRIGYISKRIIWFTSVVGVFWLTILLGLGVAIGKKLMLFTPVAVIVSVVLMGVWKTKRHV